MFKQIETKYIENKIYFNYNKTGHIIQSYRNGKRQQKGSDSRIQMATIKQRIYNITNLDKRPTFGESI